VPQPVDAGYARQEQVERDEEYAAAQQHEERGLTGPLCALKETDDHDVEREKDVAEGEVGQARGADVLRPHVGGDEQRGHGVVAHHAQQPSKSLWS